MSFDISGVCSDIENALSTVSDDDCVEIAFFGGSFTGIDRGLMISLLDIAQKYVDAGRVSSIRLSTRPDYINDEILDILTSYSVKTVELGLQSMDDDVLCACRRGHDAKCAERACAMIKERGLELIGQMMIGLPRSDVSKEIYTARRICEMGADGARIYPTVVFYETELCEMMKRGEYEALECDDAVLRTKEALKVFIENGIPCIRVGLCSGENLSSEDKVCGGANHSAIGELAMSAVYLDKICDVIDRFDGDKLPDTVAIYCPLHEISKVVGQKRANIKKITEKYGIKRVKVLEKKELLRYNIIIDFNFNG